MLVSKNFVSVIQIKMGRRVLGKALYWTHAYLVDELLIDTGPPCCAHEISRFCEGQNFSMIVNTHHHEDHVGGNHALERKFGIVTRAHPLTVKLLIKNPDIHFYRKMVWGQPRPYHAQPLEQTFESPKGTIFRVIPTPGHSVDHVCFYQENESWLFAGDLFLSPKVKVLSREENIYHILNSLKTVRKLEPSMLFCGLGGVIKNPLPALNAKIEFIESLESEIKELWHKGLSPAQIRNQLLGRETFWRIMTLDHYSKLNLIKAFLNAHPTNFC